MDKAQRKFEILKLCDRIRGAVGELQDFESVPKEDLEKWARRLLQHIEKL
jgi:hypothetical protein